MLLNMLNGKPNLIILFQFNSRKSLQFFRGSEYDVTEEIEEIKNKHSAKLEQQGECKSWSWTLQRLFSTSFLRPFSCIGILYMLVTWNGFNNMLVYMIQILQESGSTISPDLGPTIVGSIRIGFAGVVPFVIGKIKPKVLFLIGQFISTIAIALVGVYAFLQDYHSEYMEYFGWIPLASIVVLTVMRAAAILPVLHPLLNELYPTEIRY